MTPPSLLIFESTVIQFFVADFWIGSDTVRLLISKLASAKFLVADFWISSDEVFGCWFLNRQRHSNWLPISKSVATKFLAALVVDFWIGNETVCLLISESALTQFLAVDFWIDSDTVKPNKTFVLDRPIVGENWTQN